MEVGTNMVPSIDSVIHINYALWQFSSHTRWVSWYHEGKKVQIVDFYTM
jgi:hypothetical protein